MLDANDERSYTQVVHVNRLKSLPSADILQEANKKDDFVNDSEPRDQAGQEYDVKDMESVYNPAELAEKAILEKKVVKNRSGHKETFYLIQWEE